MIATILPPEKLDSQSSRAAESLPVDVFSSQHERNVDSASPACFALCNLTLNS